MGGLLLDFFQEKNYLGAIPAYFNLRKSCVSFFVSILVYGSTFHGCITIVSCLTLFKQFPIVGWFSQIFAIVITSIINICLYNCPIIFLGKMPRNEITELKHSYFLRTFELNCTPESVYQFTYYREVFE